MSGTTTARGRVLGLLDQDEMTEDGLHTFTCDQYDALWAAVEADHALLADAVAALEGLLADYCAPQVWTTCRINSHVTASAVLARIEAARSTTEVDSGPE